MASEHNSLGPASNRLYIPDSSAEPLSLSRKELETLFAQLFDDSIENRPQEVSPISAAHPENIQQPLLRKTVLQVNLQQQQGKLLPTPDNQLKIHNNNQYHNLQIMMEILSSIHLHRLQPFLI